MAKKREIKVKPASALEIVNIAIGLLPGEKPIEGISPYGSILSRLAYQHYHPARREVLCAKTWDFAREVFTLEEPSDNFRLPDNFLRVRFFDDGKEVSYTISPDRRIHTEIPVTSLTYTKDEEKPEAFDFDFIEAFTLLLAVKFGIGVFADPRIISALRGKYKELISQ